MPRLVRNNDDPNTIKILVATDNHVGYNERDPIRGDDSWRTFHEIMCLAKDRDVDMVLLAGDLFHENKPSRKSMYQVMRSLRMNCYGDKPCELDMISDASENFQGAFNHVNYEDPDINIAIPVFSIHGNHDDPAGESHLAALDLLQITGLVNYYGRTPESDNIVVKPVLLQKGTTKLALYGMSNVRDERLFRTFREGQVKFFKPGTQRDNWFNLMSVHQNRVEHTSTSWLPEKFLPDFLDLVIWGHEHECLIEPVMNPDQHFQVIQPGSSVATSLMPGEAVQKQVTILSVTGKDFISEPIPLKTVRPFVMREIVLAEEKGMKALAKKENNRAPITQFLEGIVNELIEEAKTLWIDTQDNLEEDAEVPLPLVRLRVEYTAPEDGRFDIENPQRFSNRFVGKVANTKDVVQFHRKKAAATRKTNNGIDIPDDDASAHMSIDSIKVEKLVSDFLTVQQLRVLPANHFGDAVSQFVDKDDKHAMEMFVTGTLDETIRELIAKELERDQENGATGDNGSDNDDDEALEERCGKVRVEKEKKFAAGVRKRFKTKKTKPRPDDWDSDLNGEWEDDPRALINETPDPTAETDNGVNITSKRTISKSTATTRTQSTSKSIPATKNTNTRTNKSRRTPAAADDEDDEDDVIMIDEDEDDDAFEDIQSQTTSKPSRASKTSKAPVAAKARATHTNNKTASRSKPAPNQTRLDFSQSSTQRTQPLRDRKVVHELSDDEISDDDAFDPAPITTRSRTGR